ncbi:MAG: MotA/TolQ/ExbB proton channel family protein [Pirellula sp.]
MLFYGLIFAGPLNFSILRRYCLCHAVAIATMELFFVAMVMLTAKVYSLFCQSKWMSAADAAFAELANSQLDIEDSASGIKKAQWFHTVWQTQDKVLRDSWLGQRVQFVLQRQLKRKSTEHLDDDLLERSETDSNNQHDSYGFVRIVTWAMPMLGFLGTVLGIGDTLGQMDAQALASGSQEALNSLTAGLYVAFDTTAIGLVTTMLVMFIQFAINRSEIAILSQMDTKVSESMHLCLSVKHKQQDMSKVESALQLIVEQMLDAVQLLVLKQSEHWKQTIDVAHDHWKDLGGKSAATLQESLSEAIQSSLAGYDQTVRLHSEQLARIQAEGAALIDSRWQQWQTTFSEQARSVHKQQKEMAQQTDLLRTLIDKHDAVRDMEQPLQSVLERLTDVDRFHDAAICLTEAVAVLGTQMERYGYLGRQPLRRVSKEKESDSSPRVVGKDDDSPATLPLKRRAG